MKTWRERIAEARVRGYFTDKDMGLWNSADTCFVGEQRARYDIVFNLEMTGTGPESLNRTEDSHYTLQISIIKALSCNDFDEAERLLDYVEDRALELKREIA